MQSQGYSGNDIRIAKRAIKLILLFMGVIVFLPMTWLEWQGRLSNLGDGLMIYDPSSLLSRGIRKRLNENLEAIKNSEGIFFTAAIFRDNRGFEKNSEGTGLLKPHQNEIRLVLVVETGEIFILPGSDIQIPTPILPEAEATFTLKAGDPDYALLKQLSALLKTVRLKNEYHLWK